MGHYSPLGVGFLGLHFSRIPQEILFLEVNLFLFFGWVMSFETSNGQNRFYPLFHCVFSEFFFLWNCPSCLIFCVFYGELAGGASEEAACSPVLPPPKGHLGHLRPFWESSYPFLIPFYTNNVLETTACGFGVNLSCVCMFWRPFWVFLSRLTFFSALIICRKPFIWFWREFGGVSTHFGYLRGAFRRKCPPRLGKFWVHFAGNAPPFGEILGAFRRKCPPRLGLP